VRRFVVIVVMAVVAVALPPGAVTAASAPSAARAADATITDDAAPDATTPDTRPPDATQTVTTDNEFIPEDRNLSECISAVPKPGCGSKERGGWRQALVFAVVVAGLLVIAVRIGVAIRRRDCALAGE
jgi:hypothetical protein